MDAVPVGAVRGLDNTRFPQERPRGVPTAAPCNAALGGGTEVCTPYSPRPHSEQGHPRPLSILATNPRPGGYPPRLAPTPGPPPLLPSAPGRRGGGLAAASPRLRAHPYLSALCLALHPAPTRARDAEPWPGSPTRMRGSLPAHL